MADDLITALADLEEKEVLRIMEERLSTDDPFKILDEGRCAMEIFSKRFQAIGLRNTVKIMIGGGQVDEVIKQYTGADAYGTDAMAGVSLAKEWLRGD